MAVIVLFVSNMDLMREYKAVDKFLVRWYIKSVIYM